MEKFEIYRTKILELINQNKESELIIKVAEIADNIKMEATKDIIMYNIFSDVYDEIFYDIALKKSRLSLHTKKLLETLALPINTLTIIRKDKMLNKLYKI